MGSPKINGLNSGIPKGQATLLEKQLMRINETDTSGIQTVAAKTFSWGIWRVTQGTDKIVSLGLGLSFCLKDRWDRLWIHSTRYFTYLE